MFNAPTTQPFMMNTQIVPHMVFVVFLTLPSHLSSPSTPRTPFSPGSHKHAKRVLWDAFFMFDATTTPPFTSNTQNMPTWACFGCSLPPFPHQHLKRDPKFAFQMLAG